ncbi:MAG: protein kinase [Myxococcota bacterium]
MNETGSQIQSMEAPGSLFANKYRLQRPLARGGMGLVYLAVQEPLGRSVAVKVLQEPSGDNTFRERFIAEASICARLSHPNIVTVHDYGEAENGALFMVMEYVEGETLDRVLGREVRLPATRVIPFIRQVASALSHAHRAGIVHRDLKPSNIVVTKGPDGERVKVLDFGIAKAFGRHGVHELHHDLTEAGKLIGTPRFMAPEQIRKRAVDQRTDLYALGVLSYLVASGRPPFDGDSDISLMNAHLERPAPHLKTGDRVQELELDFVIRWMLAKEPSDRPQDAGELLGQLEAAERVRTLTREVVSASRGRVAHSSGALEKLMDEHAGRRSFAGPLARRWAVVGAILAIPILVLAVLWLRGGNPRPTDAPETAGPIEVPSRPAPPPQVVEPQVEESFAPGDDGQGDLVPPREAPRGSSSPGRDEASSPARVSAKPSKPPPRRRRPAAVPLRGARDAPGPFEEQAAAEKPRASEPRDPVDPAEDTLAPNLRKKGAIVVDDLERPRVPVVD